MILAKIIRFINCDSFKITRLLFDYEFKNQLHSNSEIEIIMLKFYQSKSQLFFLFVFGTFIVIWWSLLFIWNFNIMQYLCASMFPPFADLATITYSVDAYRAGVDPYISTAFDPYHRVYNYPKLWIDIFNFLNLTGSKTYFIAMGSILFYLSLLSILLIKNNLSKKQTVLCALLLLSPVHFLLLERANGDLYILSACLLSFLLLKIDNILLNYVSLFILLLCFSLKLYPIVFLVPFLLGINSKKQLLISLSLLFLYIPTYLYFNLETLKLISQNTPQVCYLSYGRRVIFQQFIEEKLVINVLSIVTVLICTIAVVWRALPKIKMEKLNQVDLNSFSTSLFLSGGLVYLFTFLLGNNFEYRLIFLYLCIPFMIKYGAIFTLKTKNLIISATLIRFWQYLPFNYLSKVSLNLDFSLPVFILEQICSWIIFVFLLYYSLVIVIKLLNSNTIKLIQKSL